MALGVAYTYHHLSFFPFYVFLSFAISGARAFQPVETGPEGYGWPGMYVACCLPED